MVEEEEEIRDYHIRNLETSKSSIDFYELPNIFRSVDFKP